MKLILQALDVLGYILTLINMYGCNPLPPLEIVTRSEWKARAPKERECMTTPVDHVFIHHTAMDPCSDKDSCSNMMRVMQNFHMDTRDWFDIGYTFVVGGDGRVYEGRGWTTSGAHVPKYNNISVGISFMGNYMEILPSSSMLEAAWKLIDVGVEQGYIKKDYQLHGHRDGRCTLCPGDKLYEYIKEKPNFVGGKLPVYTC